MFYKNSYQLLFQWLIFAGVVCFLFYLSFDYGVLSRILMTDVTYITSLILLTFFAVSCLCAWRCYVISTQLKLGSRIDDTSSSSLAFKANKSWFQDYYQACKTDTNKSVAAELLAEKLRGANQIGWFFSGIIIKLGLLGTVIGFVIMLSSMSSIDTLVVDDVKSLMQQMTKGMGVAMNTTMIGLVCSMLTGLQFLLLDRYCDRILVAVIEHVNNKLLE